MALSQPQAKPAEPSRWQPRRISSQQGQASSQQEQHQESKEASKVKRTLKALRALWTKITND